MVGEPPHLGQLGESLPHADEPCATARRVEDHVGEGPAELLGELEAHGLLALDPVRLLEGRHVEPTHFGCSLAHDGAAVGDQAVDQVGPGPVVGSLVLVDDRGIGWHEDKRLHADSGCVGGQRTARIAGRRDGHPFDPEFVGPADRHGETPALERAGGELGLVLHPQVVQSERSTEPLALEQRCHALAERRDLGLVLDGQELLVAPHGRRPTGDRLGGHVRPDGLEVVAHPERPTLVKSLKLVVGQVGAIDGSLEVGYVAHRLSPTLKSFVGWVETVPEPGSLRSSRRCPSFHHVRPLPPRGVDLARRDDSRLPLV